MNNNFLPFQIKKTNENFKDLSSQLAEIATNVMTFGAKGDGVTDDTLAFQNAAATGKPLLIPYTSNFFKISGTINITNSVIFQGQVKMFGATGDGSHASFKITSKTADSIFIQNPMIDGGWDGTSTAGEQDHCICILGVTNVHIEGGSLTNAYGDHVYVGKNVSIKSENITISKVYMDKARRCNTAVTSANNVQIKQNKMNLAIDYVSNIDIEPNAGDSITDIIIEGNEIINTVGRTITISNIPANGTIDNVKIINNPLISSVGRAIQAVYGNVGKISVKGNNISQAYEAIRINKADDVVIEDNTIIGNTQAYIISVGVTGYLVNNVVIAKNRMKNTSGDRQSIAVEGITNFIFENNFMDGFAVSSAYVNGSLTLTNCDKSKINNNYFINNGSYALGFAGTFREIIMCGNNFIPDLINFPSYSKNAVQIGSTTVINQLVTKNNIYSASLSSNWNIQTGAVIPLTSEEIYNVKNYYSNAIPTSGTYNVGDRVFNYVPVVGQPKSWVCTVKGTQGTLNGGATTGSITSGTNTLSVSSATGIINGQYITITGVSGVKKIIAINGTTLTIDSNANATVSSVVVAFSNATFVSEGNL